MMGKAARGRNCRNRQQMLMQRLGREMQKTEAASGIVCHKPAIRQKTEERLGYYSLSDIAFATVSQEYVK